MKWTTRNRWISALLAACLALAAAAWLVWQQKQQPARVEQITLLTQRCQTAMLRDTCSVMKGGAPANGLTRLFIAGIGEVDAQAFASLKAAGDQMCSQLAAQCTADWSGQACKIGRAMYPDLTKPS